MSTRLLTWPGRDLGIRTLEALQVPHTQTHTHRNAVYTHKHKALNMETLTTRALRQGQGLSSHPPAETLG